MFLPKGLKNLKRNEIKKAIICFPLPEFHYLKNYFSSARILNWMNFKFFQVRDSIFVGPLIGAPQTALLIEVLKNLGIKKMLGIGWAGSLKEDLTPGTLFFCKKVYSMEGTIRFYFPRKRVFYPSSELTVYFKKELHEFLKGTLVSMDAPFVLEKNEKLRKELKSKFQAIDMETGTFLGLSLYYNIHSLIFHFITDIAGNQTYDRPKKTSLQEEVIKKIIEKFLEI